MAEHYDNIACVLLGTMEISEEDEDYVKVRTSVSSEYFLVCILLLSIFSLPLKVKISAYFDSSKLLSRLAYKFKTMIDKKRNDLHKVSGKNVENYSLGIRKQYFNLERSTGCFDDVYILCSFVSHKRKGIVIDRCLAYLVCQLVHF